MEKVNMIFYNDLIRPDQMQEAVMKQDFSVKLKLYRALVGMTRKDIAEILRVVPGTVKAWEDGTAKNMERIERLYGEQINKLLSKYFVGNKILNNKK